MQKGATVKTKMTPEQVRAATPATEEWVQHALKVLGSKGLDSENNSYAYCLRMYELQFPVLAGVLIRLFARPPQMPWWSRYRV